MHDLLDPNSTWPSTCESASKFSTNWSDIARIWHDKDLAANDQDVRSFKQQLQDFKNYSSKLSALVGPTQAADMLSDALYVVSTGSNDLVNNYFLVERDRYTISEWQEQIRSKAAEYLQVKL